MVFRPAGVGARPSVQQSPTHCIERLCLGTLSCQQQVRADGGPVGWPCRPTRKQPCHCPWQCSRVPWKVPNHPRPPPGRHSTRRSSREGQALTLAAHAQRAGAHALALGVGAHGAGDEGVVLDRVLVQPLQVLGLQGGSEGGWGHGWGPAGCRQRPQGMGARVPRYGWAEARPGWDMPACRDRGTDCWPAGPNPACRAPCSCPSGPSCCRRG